MHTPFHETKNGSTNSTRSLEKFLRNETGSATIEAVIWMPMFFFILAFIMNVSMVFFYESQMLRVVQDGNRAFSLGRLDDNEAVQDYILSQLAYLNANFTIATNISGGFVQTNLEAPAGELMPLNLASSVFDGIRVRVSAQHIIEF